MCQRAQFILQRNEPLRDAIYFWKTKTFGNDSIVECNWWDFGWDREPTSKQNETITCAIWHDDTKQNEAEWKTGIMWINVIATKSTKEWNANDFDIKQSSERKHRSMRVWDFDYDDGTTSDIIEILVPSFLFTGSNSSGNEWNFKNVQHFT